MRSDMPQLFSSGVLCLQPLLAVFTQPLLAVMVFDIFVIDILKSINVSSQMVVILQTIVKLKFCIAILSHGVSDYYI